MVKVGVTGGIGSGKTLLCRKWAELGAEWMNADEVAKSLMETDAGLVSEIKNRFGEKSYGKDGRLNRTYLSREAFQNQRIEELNELVHPVVYRETRRRIEEAEEKGIPVFIKEAALLLKYGRPDNLDVIVVVTAPEHFRIKRVAERDGLTAEEVKSRISRQQTQEEMMKYADYILENDQDTTAFLHKAEELFYTLKSGDHG